MLNQEIIWFSMTAVAMHSLNYPPKKTRFILSPKKNLFVCLFSNGGWQKDWYYTPKVIACNT